jgi:hypothetical protein
MLTDPCPPGRANFGHCRALSGPYCQGMPSRSRFTLDEARAAGERIGVDQGSARFDLGQFRGGAVWRLVRDDVPCR